MSIDGLQSNPWPNHWAASTASQSGGNAPWSAATTGLSIEIDQVQATFSESGSNAPSSAPSAVGTSDASTSPANPLQRLTSDIQAMLLQAQTAAGDGGTGGTPAAANPEQAVATDLQSLMADLRAAIAPNTQTANTNPTGPTGAAGHHHHHHHHGSGGEANGTFDVAAASTTGTQGASGQSVAASITTEIAQAIQAYANGGSTAAIPMLMA